MKHILTLLALFTFISCGKDDGDENGFGNSGPKDGKLHVEYSGFSGTSYHSLILVNQNQQVLHSQSQKTTNESVAITVNKGDVITGPYTISGTGTIKITYNGFIKANQSTAGGTSSGEIKPFKIE